MRGWRSPRTLDAAFAAYVGAVFVGSWVHSSGLTRPWYDAELSRWLYSVYFLAGAIVASLLSGVVILTWLVRPARNGSARAPVPVGSAPSTPERPAADSDEPLLFNPPPASPADPVDEEIDQLVKGLSEMESEVSGQAMVIMKKEAVVVPKRTIPRSPGSAPGPTGVHSEIQRVRGASARLARFLRGPMVAASAFVGLAGAMLPGVEGMLVTNYQLNTTLILGLAYGWGGLVAYAGLAVLAAIRVR